jgi:hypothetical protein
MPTFKRRLLGRNRAIAVRDLIQGGRNKPAMRVFRRYFLYRRQGAANDPYSAGCAGRVRWRRGAAPA